MRISSVLVFVSAFAISVLAWLPPAPAGADLVRWESGELSADSVRSERPALPAYRFATAAARSSMVLDLSRSGATTPLALAAGDFDEDGVPDLISGHGAAGGGVIMLRRGNGDALFPNAPGARERQARGVLQAEPFHAAANHTDLPLAPELLECGDFDADGHTDLIAAAHGKTSLWWLRGDGKGGFFAPQRVPLAGPLTALAVGEVNRRDGLADIVVATGGLSPQLAVFEGPHGALAAAPEAVSLPGEALGIALGAFDTDAFQDIAVLLSHEVVIVHGRDRKLVLGAQQRENVRPADITRLALGFEAEALIAGDFAGNGAETLSILAADGAVHALNPRQPDSLKLASTASTASFTVEPGTRRRLVRAHTSARPGDDVVVVTKGAKTLGLVTGQASAVTAMASAASALTLDLPAEAVAVLPMRLNEDTLGDFVILTTNPDQPLQYAVTALPSFVINSASCDRDANEVATPWEPPDGICATKSGECTFAAAISECRASGGRCNFQFAVPGSGMPQVCWNYTMGFIMPQGVYDGTTQSGGFVRIVNYAGDFNFPADVTLRGLFLSGATMGERAVVEGCRIGVDDDITVAVGGVLSVGRDSHVGGTTPAARNIIGSGLWITGDNVVVEGNYFGFDEQGTAHFSHGQSVQVRTNQWGQVGPKNVTIGGLAPGASNLIAGRVEIDPGTSAVLVQGNYLGADVTGKVAVYPSESGPVLDIAGSNHTIGGAATAARNLIVAAGATIPGVAVRVGRGHLNVPSEATADILLQGNYIGTDITGTARLGTWGYGIKVTGSASGVLIGGTAPGAGNVVSGMKYYGLLLEETTVGSAKQATHDNVIQGNFIGTDKTGTVAIGNSMGGIVINNSWDNLVGGIEPGARNVVSANGTIGAGYPGIRIQGASATRNTIQGNFVGVDVTGLGKLGNYGPGIYVEGTENIVGGLIPEARPVGAGHGGRGIQVLGNNLTVQGNFVGVAADGKTASGNYRGIEVVGSNNLIGGTAAGARNVIVANGSGGVVIGGTGGHTVQGNYIGVAANGATPLGNLFGVHIFSGANNMIGGVVAGAPNVIANSSEQGVIVTGGPGNSILRNILYANSMGIDLARDGITPNDPLDADDGPNRLQNAPTLTSIETVSGFTVHGALHSEPAKTYRLEFYAYCALDKGTQGEGEIFIGSRDVPTNSMGDVLFSTTFPAPPCPIITATATDPDGNTSEFSLWVQPSPPLTGTVRIAGSPPQEFASIPLAIAAAHNNDIIQLQATSYGGALTIDIPGVSITLKGGYNETFTDITGQTVLGSPLTIKRGTVIVDHIALR